jgi:mono/diheme cytochrome c family protein
MNAALAFAALLVLAASSCDEMNHQARYDHAEKSALFADGKSLQAPPDGTIARDDPAFQVALRERPPLTATLLGRGRERYTIDCAPCHDPAGYGNGIIPSRGYPHPPSFHIDRLREASSAYLVDVITNGRGVMYGHADRVSPADRWAIVAYIRALQLSQAAPAAGLSPEERAKLGEAGK